MKKKYVYFVKNKYVGDGKSRWAGMHVSRCEIFLNTLKRFKFLEVIEIDSIFEIEEQDNQYIIFYPFFEFFRQKLEFFNKQHPVLKNTIFIKTDDSQQGCDMNYLSINMHGVPRKNLEHINKKNNILGFGFVPWIKKDQINQIQKNINFNNRINKFYFSGCSWKNRYNFIMNFFKKTEVDLYLFRKTGEAGADCFYDHELKHFFHENPLSLIDYHSNLVNHKYCLCPRGYGSTYRFLESMAFGCVTISEDVEEELCHNHFIERENYLSVGNNFEKFDEVLEICKDSFLCNKIAKNGYECFMDNFALNKDYALPIKSILNILKDINKVYNNFFDLSSYLM